MKTGYARGSGCAGDGLDLVRSCDLSAGPLWTSVQTESAPFRGKEPVLWVTDDAARSRRPLGCVRTQESTI